MLISDGCGPVAIHAPAVKITAKPPPPKPKKAAPASSNAPPGSISTAHATTKAVRIGADKITLGDTFRLDVLRSLDLMRAVLGAQGVTASCADANVPFPSNPGGNSGVSSATMTNTAVKGGKVFTGNSDQSDDMKIVNALTTGAPGGGPGAPVPAVAFIAGKSLSLNRYDSTGLTKAQVSEYDKMSPSQRLGLVMRQLGPAAFAGLLGQIKAQTIGGGGGGSFTLPEGSQTVVQNAFQGLVNSGALNAKDVDALAAGPGTLLAAGNFTRSLGANGSADLSAMTDLVSALHNDPKGLAFKNQFAAASYDSGNALSLARGKSHPDAVSLLYAQGTNVVASTGSAGIENFLQSKYASTNASNGKPSSLEAIVDGSVRGEANIFQMSPNPGAPETYKGTAALLERIAGDAKGAPIGSSAANRAAAAFNGVSDGTTGTDRFGLGDENAVVHADVAGSGLRVAASHLFQNAFPSILQTSLAGQQTQINPSPIRNFLQLAFTPQYASKQEAAQIGGAVGATLGGYLSDLAALGRTHDIGTFEKTYGTIFGPPSNNGAGSIATGNDPLQNGFYVFGQILSSAKSAMDDLNDQIASQKPDKSNMSWVAVGSLAANLALTVGSFADPVIAVGDATIRLGVLANTGGNAFNSLVSANAFIDQLNDGPSGNVVWKNAPGGGEPNLGNPVLQWLFNTVEKGPSYLNEDRYAFKLGYTDGSF
jgi:hypothetical protein